MIPIQINLSDELQEIARIAERTGSKPNEVIREAINQHLARFDSADRLSYLREGCGMWADREISLASVRSDLLLERG